MTLRPAYAMHVFDVDGTLLDTNGVKAEAFYKAALPYGAYYARRMVEYHKGAGSIGRRARWEHFFRSILCQTPREGELEMVMADCTRYVLEGAYAAREVPGAIEYLASMSTREQGCLVVSGIEQEELLGLLEAHDLMQFLAADRVYGRPNKQGLMRELVEAGVIKLPAVYYGDTEDDYLSARGAGLDFVWVRGCSDWTGVRTVEDFRDLMVGA